MSKARPYSVLPVSYEKENRYNSNFHPSEIHAEKTGLTRYFEKYLLQKAISVFKFTLPEEWSYTYFLYGLFCGGYAVITNTKQFGIVAQCPPNARLYGMDLYYQPTNAIITNHLLPDINTPKLHSECEIIKLQPDYSGIMDIVSYYAELMAVASQTASVNIANSKLSYIIAVDNKSSAETFKKVTDEILSGKPAVVTGKKLFNADGRPLWETFAQNLQSNFIAPELFECIASLDADFCTEVGVPNVNIAKASGVSDAEVMSNNVDTYSKASLWLESMKSDIEKVKKLYPELEGKLDVEFRWKGGQADVTSSENVDFRAV